jgi:Gpi18-like mannosyltransferase
MSLKKQFFSVSLLFFAWFLTLHIFAYTSSMRAEFSQDQSYDGLERKYNLLTHGAFPEKFWLRFDANWYLTVAQNGYIFKESERSNIVFFPLYPLLIRFTGFFTGGNLALSGMIISTLFALLSCWLLFLFAKKEYDEQTAWRSIFFFLAFPVSFFLISIYTESLFIFLSLAAFLCARYKKWILATLCVALLTATRVTGLALLPALALEYATQQGYSLHALWRKKTFLFLLMPLGFFLFLGYQWITFGDPLLFLNGQNAWQRNASFSPASIVSKFHQYISEFSLVAQTDNPQPLATRWIDVVFFIFFITGIILSFIKTSAPLTLFSVGLLAIPLLSGSLLSMSRYMFVAFPIFLALGRAIKHPQTLFAVLFFFILFLSLFTSLFIQFYWIA